MSLKKRVNAALQAFLFVFAFGFFSLPVDSRAQVRAARIVRASPTGAVQVRRVRIKRPSPKGEKNLFSSGAGTSKTPWIIRSASQLTAFARSISEGQTYAGKTVRLAASLDLNTVRWVPAGLFSGGIRPFKGTFDGGGHVISGLKVGQALSGTTGFFALLDGARIIRLRLDDVDISGQDNVGALAGLVSNSEFVDCAVSGTVKGNEAVGGLAGTVESSRLKNSSFVGDVQGQAARIGGLLGAADAASLTDCSTSGTVRGSEVVGGIAGVLRNVRITRGSSQAMSVRGTLDVGGVAGMGEPGLSLERFVFEGSVEGRERTGGLIGQMREGTAADCVVMGEVVGGEQTGGAAGLMSGGLLRRCSVRASVLGAVGVGGLAGRMERGSAERSSSEGGVKGGEAVGGLVGQMRNGVLSDCAVSGGVSAAFGSGHEVGVREGRQPRGM